MIVLRKTLDDDDDDDIDEVFFCAEIECQKGRRRFVFYALYTHYLFPHGEYPDFVTVQCFLTLKKYTYTNTSMLRLDYEKMLCKMLFLLYRHKHQSEVTVSLLEAAQLPLKIRCSLHSLKVKSEVNSYTNRRQSFAPFNLNVRWITSDTFKSCSNLLFTPCRFLHQELREVIWEQWSQSAQINTPN